MNKVSSFSLLVCPPHLPVCYLRKDMRRTYILTLGKTDKAAGIQDLSKTTHEDAHNGATSAFMYEISH